MAERAFEIFDQNLQLGPVERDAAAKRLMHQLVSDRHVGDENFGALPVRVALSHAEIAAERHEFGVALDVGHQVEHILCRVPHVAFVAKAGHGYSAKRTANAAIK